MTHKITKGIAKYIIRISQYTIFRGGGDYTSSSSSGNNVNDIFSKSNIEASLFDEFFDYFDESNISEKLHGSTILDFGCGYGGRTVELAIRCPSSKVYGVEIYTNMIDISRAYAEKRNAANCFFDLTDKVALPYDDNTFDFILSYDVIEHVDKPEDTMNELFRVLKPGGKAYIIFPSYKGALSHHLDYITKIPGIHWFFSAETLVDSVNDILSSDYGKRFNTSLQPNPKLSHNNKFMVLPTLNGLDCASFISYTTKYNVQSINKTPLLNRFKLFGNIGARVNAAINKYLPVIGEYLTFNMAIILQKK